MYGSWGLLSNGDISVFAADATPLSFFFGSSVADSAIDGLNKIILANISSVLKLFYLEDYLIKYFFTT